MHIGTLVVVQNRAVIEDQGDVRLVVAKDIIEQDLAFLEMFAEFQKNQDTYSEYTVSLDYDLILRLILFCSTVTGQELGHGCSGLS